ncbi:MAG: PglZ domain-containing protein [Desulfatibacillaceae bacterium]
MNPFQQYLEGLLADRLKRKLVVVWYDTRREFEPFVDALGAGGGEAVPVVVVGGIAAHLARYTGSFIGLKMAVEPLVAVDRPDPLLLYIPGAARDLQTSVLMELEKGGVCLEWQLRSLARNALRERFSDADIDAMLQAEKLSYEDVVRYVAQESGQAPSVLDTVFQDCRDNAEILARWLCAPGVDTAVEDKGAGRELYGLLHTRGGMEVQPGTPLADARARALRYVLVNEFRSDLSCEPPQSVAMIPSTNKEQVQFLRKVAAAMRARHAAEYVDIADRVEQDLSLATAGIDPACLGRVDTFRFEEAALLQRAGELILAGEYGQALELVDGRRRSFWADRSLDRQSQWTACRYMAQLSREMAAVGESMPQAGKTPVAWVEAYAGDSGWYRLDLAQQKMEAWVARMIHEPEIPSALEKVRQKYEDLLHDMATGFLEALRTGGWQVSGALNQTEIHGKVVATEKTPTAYIMVDAMRYAMGHELTELLEGAREVSVRPAVAAWPTITPVGMAALLPGAATGFDVVSSGGSLAAQVDGASLADVAGRMKFMRARVAGMVEMQLEKLLAMSANKLGEVVTGAPLVVVRSQEIDTLGEMGGGVIARQLMDTMVSNVARAAYKLSACGIRRFVVTADHGHLFTRKKEDAYKTDSPGGQTVEIHRRCWVGQGGATPPGTVRLSAADLGYDSDLEFVFPTGAGVFRTGGDLGFHHGGLSLQEMVIPVVTFRLGQEKAATGPEGEVLLSDVPDKVTNRTFAIHLAMGGIFGQIPYKARPLLLCKGAVVGRAGMAFEADFDEKSQDVTIQPPKTAVVGMILENEDCHKVRVVILDPATDRVLAQSDDIPVELGTK